ncbi:MAG: hypothetical protein SF172_03220 [Burkholderiales bacterium]|nr:hypothetical protein [Burkholderiales bacterium]
MAVVIALAAMLVAWLLGKDRNWDLFNYHVYAPHLLLHGDLRLDFMGGGPQSYLNPLAYLPLHAMVAANWPDIAVGLTLAMLHSLNLFFAWLIAHERLFPDAADRHLKSLLAVLLAALSPVFLGTLGSSFADPITSVFVLAAVFWLLPRTGQVSPLHPLLAGTCLGIAIGLKLSNAPFLIAACCALVLLPGTLRSRAHAGLQMTVGALAGGMLANGWWAWRLHAEFGNPVFPLLNEHFRSPDFPAVALRPDRFIPHDWLEFLLAPLRMASSSSWVYVENSAPDLRPAVLVLCALASLVILLTRLRRRPDGASRMQLATPAMMLGVFFVVSAVLWLGASGNGRYAIPQLLLVGPLLVMIVFNLLRHARIARIACLTLVAVQLAVQLMSGNPRWGTAPWGGAWLEVTPLPAQVEVPHGYVFVGQSTASFIAPFVHPQSGFLAMQGILPLQPGGPGDARVRRFLRHFDGRLVLVFRSSARAEEVSRLPSAVHEELSQWGLAIDAGRRCHSLSRDSGVGGLNTLACPLLAGAMPDATFAAERDAVTELFDRIARACPLRFDPPAWPVVREGSFWVRRHVNTDTTVFLRGDRFYASRHDFGPWDEDLGSRANWEADSPPALLCARPLPHYLRDR